MLGKTVFGNETSILCLAISQYYYFYICVQWHDCGSCLLKYLYTAVTTDRDLHFSSCTFPSVSSLSSSLLRLLPHCYCLSLSSYCSTKATGKVRTQSRNMRLSLFFLLSALAFQLLFSSLSFIMTFLCTACAVLQVTLLYIYSSVNICRLNQRNLKVSFSSCYFFLVSPSGFFMAMGKVMAWFGSDFFLTSSPSLFSTFECLPRKCFDMS